MARLRRLPRSIRLGLIVLALLVGFATYVWAQGVGIFSRSTCTVLTSVVQGQTFCFEQATNTLKFWTGSQWVQATATATGVNNVLDFGAVGDGVTDSTAAFQAAINGGAGTVLVPPGVYEITGTLTITNGVRILGTGAGPGGVLTVGPSTTYHGSVLEHNFTGDLFRVTGVNGFVEPSVGTTFENLLLRQVAGNGTGVSGRAILAIAGSDTFKPSWIRIKNVTTETGSGRNDWTWGVYLDGAATTGFTTGLRDTWIENSRFNAGTNGTGEIFGESVANLFIDNVELNGTNTNVQLTGADAAHASTGVFITNTNTNGTLTLTRASNVLVTGGSWASVSMTSNCTNCLIYPNLITNTPATPASANNVIHAMIGGLGKKTLITSSGDSVEFRTNGIGLRNNTAAFIGTLDNQQLSFITNGSTNVLIDSTGIMTVGQGLNVTGGVFAAGRISKTATAGLAIAGVTGAPSDLVLFSANGTPTLSIPTGTNGVQIQNSGLQLGAPTSGDKGAGTVNVASSVLLNGVVVLKSTGTPTCINNCGATPTVVGNDSAFTITLGTTLQNSFAVRFATAYAAAPACVAAQNGAPQATATVASVNTTSTGVTVNLVGAPANGTIYSGICHGVTAG